MYELADYLAMLADGHRVDAHLAALRATVRPGDRVLELGTGFGFFAIAAARLGAAHVWALEPLDVIALGQATARANGMDDRITFVQEYSTRFELEPRADVLLEDMRGVSPLHGARLPALLDARARLLVPGARMIPRRDRLLLTPAAAPAYERARDAAVSAARAEISIEVPLAHSATSWRRVRAAEALPLAPSAAWAQIEYATFTSADLGGTAAWRIERDGTLAGFVDSFEAELAPGVSYATGPGEPASIHGCGWYPLPTPVEVRRGDEVSCRMRAKFDGSDYVMAWDTTVMSAGRRAPAVQRATTLLDRAPSPARLAKRAGSHRPELGDEARLLREVLKLADGRRTIEQIADAVRTSHPGRFVDAVDALRWVGTRLAALDEVPPL